ncbi:uvrD/Rep family helicase domain protein [Mycobacterium xenopi 3993]|nr:uvrD/Rep family helicase domain protein [Mycobacterium xenopi 3993]
MANGYAAPDQVLGLTFTRKAAGQLLRRSAPGWPAWPAWV